MPGTTTRFAIRELPHVTALFWALKIVATTWGETGGDFVAQTMNVGYLASTVLSPGCFVVAVTVQMKARRFNPAVFWTVIVTTSSAGTTLSDFMNRTGGLGYTGGALVLSSLLAMVFIVWWRKGQTLDVENIATLRSETLYWVAVVCSNSLGTSSGTSLPTPSTSASSVIRSSCRSACWRFWPCTTSPGSAVC